MTPFLTLSTMSLLKFSILSLHVTPLSSNIILSPSSCIQAATACRELLPTGCCGCERPQCWLSSKGNPQRLTPRHLCIQVACCCLPAGDRSVCICSLITEMSDRQISRYSSCCYLPLAAGWKRNTCRSTSCATEQAFLMPAIL